MKNNFKFLIAFFFLCNGVNYAQTGVGTTTPDPSAVLDVASSTKGFLVPRHSATSRDAIVLPATGLIVYNTTTNQLQTNTGTPSVPIWTSSGAGATGPQGIAGTNGTAVLNGTTDPLAATGADGDFYINTATNTIFGPKAASTWPATGTSIIGATGPQGPAGSNATADGDAWAVTGEDQTSAISRSGNVGIGTTTPTTKLDVNGAISVRGNNATNAIDHTSAITLVGGLGSPNAGEIRFGDGTGWKMNFAQAEDDGAIKLMTLTDGGDLGIGTISPTAKLDINGNARIQLLPAGISTDEVVTTDASGFLRKLPASNFTGATGLQGPIGATGPQGPAGNDGVGGVTTAGTNITITGSGTVSSPYVVNAAATPVSASNGLTATGSDISLGGTLTANTIVNQGTNNLTFSGTGRTIVGGSFQTQGTLYAKAPRVHPIASSVTWQDDDVVILLQSTHTGQIVFPSASANPNRLIGINNRSGSARSITNVTGGDTGIYANEALSAIASASGVSWFVSDGISWRLYSGRP